MSLKQSYTHRHQAVIRVCAESPLCVGTGEGDFNTDDKIARDAFGIPYIPGTGLTGALRASLNKKEEDKKEKEEKKNKKASKVDKYFGFSSARESQGSRLMVSSAHIFINDKVADGLEAIEANLDKIQEQVIANMAMREHVRINEKGVAADKGKFELEYLPKGVKMVFELEFLSNNTAEENEFWNELLNEIRQPWFRIGGNTRKGFGQLGIEEIYVRCLDLTEASQRQAYLDKSSRIELPQAGKDSWTKLDQFKPQENKGYTHYQLKLKARDFFLFDGFNLELFKDDKDPEHKPADFHPKQERVLVYGYCNEKKQWKYESVVKYLIPASSIKGALRHRFAYHYNCLTDTYIKPEDFEAKLSRIEAEMDKLTKQKESIIEDFQKECEGKSLAELQKLNLEQNFAPYERALAKVEAQLGNLLALAAKDSPSAGDDEDLLLSIKGVEDLFGSALDTKKNKDKKQSQGQKGRVLIQDLYIDTEKTKAQKKVLNHVKIDRFTGGAIDTALFTEEVLEYDQELIFDFYVEEQAFKDKQVKEAWNRCLEDLKQSRLALGGGTMRGHGMFKGELYINPNNQEKP